MSIFAKQGGAVAVLALLVSPVAVLSVQAADVTTNDNVGVTMEPHIDANGGILAGNEKTDTTAGTTGAGAMRTGGTKASGSADANGGFAVNKQPDGAAANSPNATGTLNANTSVGVNSSAGATTTGSAGAQIR